MEGKAMSYNVKKNCYKTSVLYVIFFFVPSLYCMGQKPLVSYDLITLLIPSMLPKNTIPKELNMLAASHLTLQNISAVKRVNKAANLYWNFENICNCLQVGCDTAVYESLKKYKYNIHTRFLVYYAEQNNITMF